MVGEIAEKSLEALANRWPGVKQDMKGDIGYGDSNKRKEDKHNGQRRWGHERQEQRYVAELGRYTDFGEN